MNTKLKSNLLEFIRYAIVGGVCAVIDIAVNSFMLHIVFGTDKNNAPMVAISVALGFLVGLVANFLLSNLFVFKSSEQKEKGKSVYGFVIYAVVGIIGFALTEALTLLGTYIISDGGIWYVILSCSVKLIVLVWNYLGRKIFVYKGK